MKIAVINGPNLNMLGKREPEIYGSENFSDFLEGMRAAFPEVEISYDQSNCEGVLIDIMQDKNDSADGIILNAGAYTHTSIALLDCIRSLSIPVVEVHISNVHAREEYRRLSMISPACLGVISGFGYDSYRLALIALIGHLKK